MDKRIIIYMIFLGLSFYVIQTYLVPKSTYQQPIENEISINNKKLNSEIIQKEDSEEKLYVLENEYQQVVFSNIGGSIAEINLPFKNNNNEKSIVRPIEFDKIIEKTSPENNHFPNKPYYTFGFKKNDNNKTGGYYPLLRRSLYDENNKLKHKIPSKYNALNIHDEDNSLSNITYKVVRFKKKSNRI